MNYGNAALIRFYKKELEGIKIDNFKIIIK